MTRVFVSAIALLCISCLAAASDDSLRHMNLEKGNVAVSGYDVVTYFGEAGPSLGEKSIALEHRGVTYRFSSEANRDLFKSAPERYLPAFGGWCAWAMLDGDKTKVNPETYKIYDGRLFLFYDGFWGDTLKSWNERAESEPEEEMAHTALRMWNKLLNM